MSVFEHWSISLSHQGVVCLFLSVLLNDSDLSPVISKSPLMAHFVSRVAMLLEVVSRWWMKAIDYWWLCNREWKKPATGLVCDVQFFVCLVFRFNNCFIAEKCSKTFLIFLELAWFHRTFWGVCHRIGLVVLNTRSVRPESFIWRSWKRKTEFVNLVYDHRTQDLPGTLGDDLIQHLPACELQTANRNLKQGGTG